MNRNYIYNPPFNTLIPNDGFFYCISKSTLRVVIDEIRYYRRQMLLIMYGQFFLEKKTIPNDTKKILWFNSSSTSIGDAIMELSGRYLLKDRYEIDLYTDSNNASVFVDDDIFNRIYNSIEAISDKYDLIFLDICNTKSVKLKAKYFKNIPFCHIQGFFYGFDFNRMLFSYHRINFLLHTPYSQIELDNISRNYLTHLNNNNSSKNIVIAIGGEDKTRQYNNWHEVILILFKKYNNFTINLVGSKNGISDSLKIAEACKVFKTQLNNYVGTLSINDTMQIIAKATYFIGVDGGLMHIAEAYHLHGLALFARFNPIYRLSYMSRLSFLYDKIDVNNIAFEQIITVLDKIIL